MKYFVSIGDRTIEVDVAGEAVVVDGVSHAAHVERVGNELWLTVDGRTMRLGALRSSTGSWQIIHRGAVHDVLAEDSRARHIRLLAGAARGASGAAHLKAPMPGLVVRVEVGAGDVVQAGQGLIVLEAMKMENELKAPAGATVSAIRVGAGEAVEKGQVLIEFAGDG